jgi:hypothetical protein
MVSLYFRWDYPAYFVLILCERGGRSKVFIKKRIKGDNNAGETI